MGDVNVVKYVVKHYGQTYGKHAWSSTHGQRHDAFHKTHLSYDTTPPTKSPTPTPITCDSAQHLN